MAKRKKRIPDKLKHDAIVEALLELRFETETIPEVLIGRLADCPSWNGFEQERMPAYDIPAIMRQTDQNFRYAPIFELHNADRNRIVRIGSQVLSFHRLVPYEGWSKFKLELDTVVDNLFAKADKLVIKRLGLRYINAIRTNLHGINSISELDMTIAVEGEAVSGKVNVNFTIDVSTETQCMVRVTTPEFVQGALPSNSPVLIDVDVFTKEVFQTHSADETKKWISAAHDAEKQQFFSLLKDSTIDALEEK